jgi:putative nucleotidyltransferase with HDIG domain
MIFDMRRLEQLRQKVNELYKAKKEGRDDWADWLYKNHIFLVAEEAGRLADRFGAKRELAMAAGMLHDIADAMMSRFNPSHEEKSISIAKEFLRYCSFSDDEIHIIVDDAMKYHSCHDGHVPQSPEGKAMATADAVIHLTSDFYEYAVQVKKKEESIESIKKWVLLKIERDFNNKILIEEVQKEVRPDYERQKTFFSGKF